MGSAPASAPLGANGHACGACHDLAHGAYVASAHAAATPPGGLAMPNSFDRFSAASADAGADAAGKVAAAIAAESAARSAHEASLNALSAAALSQSDSDAALHLARQRASDARAALERAKLQCAAAEDHERQAEMAAEEAKASHRALEAALAEAAQKLEACAAEVESARAAEEREAQKRQQQESQRQQEQQQAEAQQQAQWHCSSLAKAAPPARAHAASLESSLSPAPPCASLLGGGGAPLPAVDGHAELSRLLSSLSLERLMPMLQANDIDSVSSLRLLTDADYKVRRVDQSARSLRAVRAHAHGTLPEALCHVRSTVLWPSQMHGIFISVLLKSHVHVCTLKYARHPSPSFVCRFALSPKPCPALFMCTPRPQLSVAPFLLAEDRALIR
uniref:SAM domain-containing protein n=2 Tax=Chrysotila carterae TaxID=13221 RepID=A0A7S4BF71_CHRCT